MKLWYRFINSVWRINEPVEVKKILGIKKALND